MAFDGFLDHIVENKEDHELFKRYYSKLNNKLQESKEDTRKSAYNYLHNLAVNKLESAQPEWFTAIKPYFENADSQEDKDVNNRVKISFFLTRYGAYQEFLKKKAILVDGSQFKQESESKNSIWDTLKGYVSTARSKLKKASNKVAGWFGLGKESVAA